MSMEEKEKWHMPRRSGKVYAKHQGSQSCDSGHAHLAKDRWRLHIGVISLNY